MATATVPVAHRLPAALADARRLVADPERAAAAPPSRRLLAWAILTTANGGALRQRPANAPGGPR